MTWHSVDTYTGVVNRPLVLLLQQQAMFVDSGMMDRKVRPYTSGSKSGSYRTSQYPVHTG